MERSSSEITSYIPGLRRYASALMRNPMEAEDLVQECLCRAIARARPWRSIRDVRAYLFTILHNLYVDKIAKRSKTRDIVSDDLVEKKLVALPSQIGRLEIRDLGRALNQLSREQREVTLLIGLEARPIFSKTHPFTRQNLRTIDKKMTQPESLEPRQMNPFSDSRLHGNDS